MPKIIRDPIHNIIEIDDDALKLIDTGTFQRLRRIRQLGLAWFVYPTAEHSRFTHSLGVYHLSKRLIDVLLSRLKPTDVSDPSFIDKLKGERRILMLSALLHDVGHGAFSHTLEQAIKEIGGSFDHEDYTKKIILQDTEINDALTSIDGSLPTKICEVIDKEYENPILATIVTSQLDADRMDYLLRDSHMTGARYGSYDLEWILQNIYIKTINTEGENKGDLVIAVDSKKCLNTIEQYLLGRFFMYKHVYNHKVVRGFECIVRGIFKRVLNEKHDLVGIDLLKGFADNSISLDDFLGIDDFTIIEWFKRWRVQTDDTILKDLLSRFFYRKPLKVIELAENDPLEMYEKLKSLCELLQYDKDYFLYYDRINSKAIKEYDEIKYITDAIYVIKDNSMVTKIGHIPSSFISNIKSIIEKEEIRFYVPEAVYNKYKGDE